MCRLAILTFCLIWPWLARAETVPVCTVMVDVETRETLRRTGDCDRRTTPASTFKIALAAIGFEQGVLISADAPVFSHQRGDPYWGGSAWLQDTDPTAWMTHSVIWYSRRLTHRLGQGLLSSELERLGYGNADFSGDAGYDNALDRAWVSSSLTISPVEQVTFLAGLVNRDLPLSKVSMAQATSLVQRWTIGDITLHGKTGAAYPRKPDRSFDDTAGIGWFVGWLETGDRRVAFAKLITMTERTGVSPGHQARDDFLADLPDVIQALE